MTPFANTFPSAEPLALVPTQVLHVELMKRHDGCVISYRDRQSGDIEMSYGGDIGDLRELVDASAFTLEMLDQDDDDD